MKPNEGGDEHEFHDAEDERAAALAGEKIYGSCRTD
jgi:hypothetical protein